METCPFCGNQLISCGCCYKILGIDVSEGTWAYYHGLTKKQSDNILSEKGLIPYVRIPILCAMCGELYPDMFDVPDEEWDKFVIPELQSKVLCRFCYDTQVRLFPNGWRNAKHRS